MECLFNLYILYYFITIKSKRKKAITLQDLDPQNNLLEIESANSLENSTPHGSDTIRVDTYRSLEAPFRDKTTGLKSTEKHLLSLYEKSSESWRTEESPIKR